jgi:hypothetical protein
MFDPRLFNIFRTAGTLAPGPTCVYSMGSSLLGSVLLDHNLMVYSNNEIKISATRK